MKKKLVLNLVMNVVKDIVFLRQLWSRKLVFLAGSGTPTVTSPCNDTPVDETKEAQSNTSNLVMNLVIRIVFNIVKDHSVAAKSWPLPNDSGLLS